MDKKEANKIESESIIFIELNNEYRGILKQSKNKQNNFTKQNKEIMAFSSGKKNNKKQIYSTNFLNYKGYNITLFKISEKFFLIYTIILFLLSLNGILCESHIMVKINKVGRYKLLYNGGVEDSSHVCYTVPNYTPKRITINGNEIDTFTREYNFTQLENTIKLYYEDSKDDFKCLFYGCSDIDEIDASNLITSNVNHMEYMFHGCNDLCLVYAHL